MHDYLTLANGGFTSLFKGTKIETALPNQAIKSRSLRFSFFRF